MKVKALADRGIDGERAAAQRLLEELMEKYHIDEADINTEKTNIYLIDAGDPIFKDLFRQIYLVKFGRNRDIWCIDKMPKKDKRGCAAHGDGGFGRAALVDRLAAVSDATLPRRFRRRRGRRPAVRPVEAVAGLHADADRLR